MSDVIDALAGIAAGSRLDAARGLRPVARTQAQASHDALFAPADPGPVSLAERFAVAVFVALLHREAGVADHYGHTLDSATAQAIALAADAGAAIGPYGQYDTPALAAESKAGPVFGVPVAARAALGARLVAALEHAHMLVFHPRDAAPAHLQALLAAGWTTDGIVTLSQLVAFLSFQIRVVFGLRVLA